MKRVLLVDDHTLFREGLAGILDAQPDLEVVGQAGDGSEALVKAHKLAPDLVLMDIEMPGCDGLKATQHIKAQLPGVLVIILTVQDDDEMLFQAIRNGADGYVLKSISSREMLELLYGALRGEAAITPALARRMLDEFRRLSQRTLPAPDEQAIWLTPREREVLGLAAQGAMDKEIAEALTITTHTVKRHMSNILTKLHLSSRHEAAQFALRAGLIPPPPDAPR